jgi:hypothetical protein
MPTIFTRLLLLLTVLLIAGRSHAQTIDTEAAMAYWRLTDGLRHNEPLTDVAWQAFLALPANKVYVRECFNGDEDVQRYRRAMEVVYMPRHDSLLQTKLRAKSWYYVLLNDYKQHEQEYRTFLAETVAKPAYLEKMYTYAYEYLPARNHTKVDNLKLGYVALGNDATSQDEGIYFSLYAARHSALIRPGILEAHEMHHQLIWGDKLVSPALPGDEGLLWLLRMALIEGIADLTDKKVYVEQSADSTEIRNWGLKPAPTALQKLDSTIQVQAAGRGATPLKFYRRLTKGSNGHVPGFFMAYTIYQNGFIKQLLDHADDPFAFALLYQKAAKKDKRRPPIFSAVSERYLKQLARKYAKPRPAPATAAK